MSIFCLLFDDIFANLIESIIKIQQRNNAGNHTGGDGGRSESPKAEQVVEDSDNAGDGKSFCAAANQLFGVHLSTSPIFIPYPKPIPVSSPYPHSTFSGYPVLIVGKASVKSLHIVAFCKCPAVRDDPLFYQQAARPWQIGSSFEPNRRERRVENSPQLREGGISAVSNKLTARHDLPLAIQ